MKICTKCGEEKSLTDFYKKKEVKSGLTAWCKACFHEKSKERYAEHREEELKRAREYRINNRERLIAYFKEWKRKNPDIKKKFNDKWVNQNREKDRLIKAAYKKRNPDKNCASTNKRRAAKAKATPLWLTDTQLAQIQWFYSAAKMMTETTGIKHHVDHIHPLSSAGFNGLHVPWNLRVIKSTENISKGCKPPKEEASLFWQVKIYQRRAA